MAARRNNRGRRRRRGRFGFLYVPLSFFLIVAALMAGSVVFFRADRITVTGQGRYTAEEIIAAAQVRVGDNLFLINGPRSAQRIMASLPYIHSASVYPHPPNELVITVTESQVAASIQAPGGRFLLDARGKLLELDTTSSSGAAPVTGITPLTPTVGTALAVSEGERTRLEALISLLTVLEARDELDLLVQVDLSSSSTLTFGYTHRFTAKLPLHCDFDYKIRALAYVVDQLEDNETGLIDLTREDIHFIPG